jgi:hypothetical protein
MWRNRVLLIPIVAMSWTTLASAQATLSDKQTTAPESKPSWVVVEEDVWLRFNDEPSQYLQQAHESFLKKEYKVTAQNLRKAAGYLQVAAQNGASRAKSALVASADELDRLAKDVESGTVKSGKDLESAFARAEHALAFDHQAKAQTAIAENQHVRAGHYLHSAVGHLENAAKWSGHQLERGAVATADGVRLLSGKLVEGSGYVVEEAGKSVKWVGEEVDKLGKLIAPHQQ